VLVKAWQTPRAAGQLRDCLPLGGLALTLQNGMGNREILAQELGESRVFLGSVTTGAYLLEPGQVKAGGEGVLTLDDKAPLESLAGLFRQAGFNLQTAADITSLLWGKLVINTAINPLTALLRATNGALLENPASRRLLRETAQESAGVAAAMGITLPYPDAAAAAEGVARRTAQNRSSMLQDVLRGAPTEIDAICGAIVGEAEKCGVPAPINQTLWLLVKSIGKK
jgi:2-dehydropantoate 2-reductase